MRIRTTLLAACTAVLLVPAASQAATLTNSGSKIVYSGEGSEGLSLLVTDYQDFETGENYLRFYESGAGVEVSGDLCSVHQYGGVVCERPQNAKIEITGTSARDEISLYSSDAVPDSYEVTMEGREGDDYLEDVYDGGAGRTLVGGDGDDELVGYAGDDTLEGGEGNDKLDGGEDDDRLLGGGGDDQMEGDGHKAPGSDLLDGGPGYDYIDEWSIADLLQRNPAVNVTLDGAANDGRPGENDNVIGVEDFQMYTVGSFSGTDAREKIVIFNPANSGPSTLIGRGGDDELVGHDFNDTVDGGAGNDHVEGGLGNDTVTGGPGQDTIHGDATASRCTYYSCKISFGNDVIDARDGEVDNIDCGVGQDKAIVDSVDVLSSCEAVDAAGPGGGNGGGDGAGKLSLSIAGATLAAVASKGLKVKVACAAACSAKGTATADKATARKLGAGKVAGGSGKAAKAGTVTVTLKVAKKVARRLKRLKSARLTVKVTVTEGGATRSGSRKVTLKR